MPLVFAITQAFYNSRVMGATDDCVSLPTRKDRSFFAATGGVS